MKLRNRYRAARHVLLNNSYKATRLKRVPLSDTFENCCLLHAFSEALFLLEGSEQSGTMDSSLRLKPELLKLS